MQHPNNSILTHCFPPALSIPSTFDRDIEYAGIPKETDEGIADIHCLRHTVATRLARHNIPIAIAQRILRHSDPKITMSIYSHLGILDTHAAVESLPDFIKTSASNKNAGAT